MSTAAAVQMAERWANISREMDLDIGFGMIFRKGIGRAKTHY